MKKVAGAIAARQPPTTPGQAQSPVGNGLRLKGASCCTRSGRQGALGAEAGGTGCRLKVSVNEMSTQMKRWREGMGREQCM
eukprot:40299-Pelagomonas_calceolata.AAC.4